MRAERARVEQRRHDLRGELADAAAALEHAVGAQLVAELRRRVDPPQAQPGRQRLGERAEPHHRRLRVEGAERRRRLAVVHELAVDVVLDDHQVLAPRELEQPLAARGREAHARRVVERRDGVQQARAVAPRLRLAHGLRQRVDVQALLVDAHADDVHGVVGDDAEREVVGGALDEDHVAGPREVGEHLAEGLGVAAADEHVVGGERQALTLRGARGDVRAQLLGAGAGAVGERPGGAGSGERARGGVAHQPDRQQRRVGLAEGELDEALAQLVLGEDGRLGHGAMIRDAAAMRVGARRVARASAPALARAPRPRPNPGWRPAVPFPRLGSRTRRMLFPTITFAVFFLLVFVGNWLLMPRQRVWKPFMLVVSLVFYGWWDWRFVLLLALSAAVNQFFALWIAGLRPKSSAASGRWPPPSPPTSACSAGSSTTASSSPPPSTRSTPSA